MTGPNQPSDKAVRHVPALEIDLVLVMAFAIIGRAAHGEPFSWAPVALAAAPFLAGAVVGNLIVMRFDIESWWKSGLIVWGTTVVLGILLRAVIGGSVDLSFVLVTALVLAGFLLGWRLIRELFVRWRASRAAAQDSSGPSQ